MAEIHFDTPSPRLHRAIVVHDIDGLERQPGRVVQEQVDDDGTCQVAPGEDIAMRASKLRLFILADRTHPYPNPILLVMGLVKKASKLMERERAK
jgi:hypothetical protein